MPNPAMNNPNIVRSRQSHGHRAGPDRALRQAARETTSRSEDLKKFSGTDRGARFPTSRRQFSDCLHGRWGPEGRAPARILYGRAVETVRLDDVHLPRPGESSS